MSLVTKKHLNMVLQTIKKLLSFKADKIVGSEGQFVGFDADGDPVGQNAAGAKEALATLAELDIVEPAHQDGVIYTDADGSIFTI